MSDTADARDTLERLADMAPFTDRELTLLRMISFDEDVRRDLRESGERWTGKKALSMLDLIEGDDAADV